MLLEKIISTLKNFNLLPSDDDFNIPEIEGDYSLKDQSLEFKFNKHRIIIPVVISMLIPNKEKLISNALFTFSGSFFAQFETLRLMTPKSNTLKLEKRIEEIDEFIKSGHYDCTEEIKQKEIIIKFLNTYRHGQNIFGERFYFYSLLAYDKGDYIWGVNPSPTLFGTILCSTSLAFKRSRPFAFGYIAEYLLRLASQKFKINLKYTDVVKLDKSIMPQKLVLFSNANSNKNHPTQDSLYYSFGKTANLFKK